MLLPCLLAGSASTAHAVILAPAPADIAAAAREGVGLFKAGEGYRLKDYVIYEVRDARTIDPADGSVDAIVFATPYERTRHAAFLGVYTREPLTPDAARAEAGLPDNWVSFIVFAHGNDREDQNFPARFGKATLEIGGRIIPAAGVEQSVVSESTYPLLPADRERHVATISYRFDLGGVRLAADNKAILRFVDAQGKAHSIAFHTGRYR